MVFLFALSLQPVSVMIPNIVNQNQLTNYIHFIMKKILLTAVVMLASVASYAQQAVGTFTLQPKIGMNIADLTNEDKSDARIGLAVGAEFEYQVTDIVSVSFGALYSMQGCKADDATVKLDYINVPLLANVYVAKGFAVKLGLQPGFKVNYKYSADGVSVDGDKLMKANGVDLSIPVGVSYEYQNFVLDGRYNFGVTKVFDVDGAKDKNSVFQITLGYKFAL